MTLLPTTILYGGAAAICALWALLVVAAGRSATALLLAAALLAAAIWAAAVALAPETPLAGLSGMLEVGRGALWFAVLLALCWRIAGARSRPLLWRLGACGVAVTALALLSMVPGMAAALSLPSLGSPAVLARLSVALLVVMMAENLYFATAPDARWHVVLPCIALGGLAAFDLVLYADAALSGAFSSGLIDARAVLTAASAPLLAIGAIRDRRARRDPPVSRAAVFHGTTLMVAGTFLLGIGAAGEALRHLGEPWARALQFGLAGGAVMAALVAMTARSVRSRLRRLVVDQFFLARFDYRREWLRCVASLSVDDGDTPADIRAIRAIADAVDSPAGLLLQREAETGTLRWAGAWNAPSEGFHGTDEAALLAALRDGEWVAQPGPDALGALRAAFPPLWLVVPLMHHRQGLLGAVILARPRAHFALDGEVFALLRTLGREVAMFLAERRSAAQLTDQQRVAAYAQRFTFVAHDVKTVAAQLRMLSANAASHIADPAFQRDLLITLGAASERIDTLIARLRRPATDTAARIDPLIRLRRLAAERQTMVTVECEGASGGQIVMAPEAFDAAITHLLDNAAEASTPGGAVRLRLRQDGARLVLDIRDAGPGMTAAFVRDELFRPLATSRPNGTGIGAWQARALVREAGGEVTALSSPGAGTIMRVTLPMIPAEAPIAQTSQAVAAGASA